MRQARHGAFATGLQRCSDCSDCSDSTRHASNIRRQNCVARSNTACNRPNAEGCQKGCTCSLVVVIIRPLCAERRDHGGKVESLVQRRPEILALHAAPALIQLDDIARRLPAKFGAIAPQRSAHLQAQDDEGLATHACRLQCTMTHLLQSCSHIHKLAQHCSLWWPRALLRPPI